MKVLMCTDMEIHTKSGISSILSCYSRTQKGSGKKRDNGDSDIPITLSLSITLLGRKYGGKYGSSRQEKGISFLNTNVGSWKLAPFSFRVHSSSQTPKQITLWMWAAAAEGADSTTKMYSSTRFWWSALSESTILLYQICNTKRRCIQEVAVLGC